MVFKLPSVTEPFPVCRTYFIPSIIGLKHYVDVDKLSKRARKPVLFRA